MKFSRKHIWMISALLACLLAVLFVWSKGSDTPFLFSDRGANWIYIDRPFNVNAQFNGEYGSYRKIFNVLAIPARSLLTVRSLRVSNVYIDGEHVLPVKTEFSRSKGTSLFDLTGLLSPGVHELLIRVYNENGPAIVLAYSDDLDLSTGPGWEASYDELKWRPAVPADKKKQPELAEHFVSSDNAILSLLPLYGSVFLGVFSLTLIALGNGQAGEKIRKFMPAPSSARWFLLAFSAGLAINNILKVPIAIGMDVIEHYEYIDYILRQGRLPLATEGWQMFQSPLYYMLSAILWKFPLGQWFHGQTGMLMLRSIPLLCGLLQIEVAYRSSRVVFPDRHDLQIVGTTIGGLLPMNLYISQVVGNEPLAGLLSAIAVVIGLKMLTSEQQVIHARYFILLGTILGLALLTKVTAVLLIPPSALLVIYVLNKRQYSVKHIVKTVLWFAGIIIVISGWYYVRNWMVYGKFFIGGWESNKWWQDPGYRTFSQFLTFGQAVSAPVYSAVDGFWDSLYSTLWLDGNISGIGAYAYRPPWNYDFMISGALLSLLPAAGILIGLFLTATRRLPRAQPALIYSAACIAVYIAALLYMYMTLPVWSTAKATYTLGLLPCYALLSTAGIDFLSRNNILRAATYGCLACWAIAAYCSYFVL